MNEVHSDIIQILKGKSLLKQEVFDLTLKTMDQIKNILKETVQFFNGELRNTDKRIHLEYSDRGQMEAQLKVAGDLLIFSMHSNIFAFNREHPVWQLPYLKEDKSNSYCGIINIFNFLADSFKYNRFDDLGYLIGRIFVNRQNHFMVEGKRQFGFFYNNFGKDILTRQNLRQIIDNSIKYALEFDLLVPPYDAVKVVTVGQLQQKMENTRVSTGKRLGFTFNSDDVSNP